MKKRTISFLAGSVVGISIVCIVVFVWMLGDMQKKNKNALDDVCGVYMSEMSHQLEGHFRTIIDLRLSMAEGIVKRYPPTQDIEYRQDMMDELTFGAQIRDYSYLALYSADGEIELICGEPVDIINEEPFLESVQQGESKVTSGQTASGQMMLLLSVNASYPMKNGGYSMALVVGQPLEDIVDAMSLNEDATLVYSHIVRTNGSFVLKGTEIEANDFFGWMQTVTYEKTTAEQETRRLQEVLDAGGRYSVSVTENGERCDIFCEKLQKTEWFLVTVMQQGSLDQTLANLGEHHLYTAIGSCAVIMITLLIIYLFYFRISIKWMEELRCAQEKAQEASRAKSEFLSNMSHDIRTPMNAIVGMTAIAVSNEDKPEVVQDCLRKITLSSKHLLGLINDVLDMSKIESGKLTLTVEEISLRDTMQGSVGVVLPLIKERNQNFNVVIADIQNEQVFCDSVRLNQVLINLLSNAVKFTPEGGLVEIHLSQEPSPKGDKYVRTHVKVHDTGIGMTPEFQEKVFDAFVREDSKRVQRTEGSGLGMAITKYIVDVMEGTIEVNSELGKGSEFHITLDLEKALIEEKDMRLPEWDVLVVDDDEQMCRSTVENLRQIGVKTEWASDGETAIQMAVARHEAKNDYQIILLDWRMPDKNGIETAEEMRRRIGKDMPILLMSAYDWGEIEGPAREAGVKGFLSKPLFKSTLYHGLMNFMGESDEKEEKSTRVDFNGNNRHLLAAEDNDMNWDILDALLGNYGFLLERAENGQICVDMFQKSEVGYYSAVLMDLRMPVMNGYEATKEIRKLEREDASLPIVAMTADAFSEDIQKCLACGMNAHVAKPIDMNEVIAVLSRLL